ncbi:acetyl esterase [Kribbella sp. VKM Ac-2527]|uniref:Acetyl esterase n=1 Tax=Kribbella caucasensis TaxID=2512215 RepID=A0A4R6K827_9ACTN|nr:alpha/beta hydrolase fold domain-containing protein [Kribbella sp. VKM Ac-2527]TDO45740.1 acetyl esterase [Kribbella sp. VKM Ac-2527]
MSILARPAVASLAAKAFQRLVSLSDRGTSRDSFPEFPRNTRELTIPTSVAPARVVVYLPAEYDGTPPVHVNFHGGGYVLAPTEVDDALCRYLAAEAGVVVINVDYVVAPQHPFPEPPRQAFEVVRWVAENGAGQGWDGARLSVGGQSAGGGLAAAVARLALDEGGPAIALQVLHYPPLDLAIDARDKRAAIAKPVLRPWMADIFDNAYVPDPQQRTDRLVSPANPADIADLTGIAPAVVLTPEYDLLRVEGLRYADRLANVGALVEHKDIAGADHGYDLKDLVNARESYALIAQHVRQATGAQASEET